MNQEDHKEGQKITKIAAFLVIVTIVVGLCDPGGPLVVLLSFVVLFS